MDLEIVLKLQFLLRSNSNFSELCFEKILARYADLDQYKIETWDLNSLASHFETDDEGLLDGIKQLLNASWKSFDSSDVGYASVFERAEV